MKKIGRQLHDEELLVKKQLIAQLNVEREQLLEGLLLSGDNDRKNGPLRYRANDFPCKAFLA